MLRNVRFAGINSLAGGSDARTLTTTTFETFDLKLESFRGLFAL